MNLRYRLTLGIGVLFVLILLLGGLSVGYVRQLSAASGNILADNYNSVHYAEEMLRSLDRLSQDSSSRATLIRSLSLQRQNITEVDESEATASLGRRIAASPQLRREQPFNILLEVNGSMAAVQGIIDCCFEEDGAWVLLDYKTTRVESAAELARRAPQLRKTYAAQMVIYRRALEAATGMPVRETYLYLTNLGETIRM